jgi:nitrate/TMAO reductase-like tetraheme cytochrome c subunit
VQCSGGLLTGQAGILIVLIVLSVVLAGIFLARPTITAGPTGKILAFLGLFILPALCIAGGMSAHMQRSEQTQFCISCHSMDPYGRSLYVDDPKYIPASHFQNHPVPVDQACYACHADYTIFGPLRDKLRGVTRIYMQLYAVCEYATQSHPHTRRLQQRAVFALPRRRAQF